MEIRVQLAALSMQDLAECLRGMGWGRLPEGEALRRRLVTEEYQSRYEQHLRGLSDAEVLKLIRQEESGGEADRVTVVERGAEWAVFCERFPDAEMAAEFAAELGRPQVPAALRAAADLIRG